MLHVTMLPCHVTIQKFNVVIWASSQWFVCCFITSVVRFRSWSKIVLGFLCSFILRRHSRCWSFRRPTRRNYGVAGTLTLLGTLVSSIPSIPGWLFSTVLVIFGRNWRRSTYLKKRRLVLEGTLVSSIPSIPGWLFSTVLVIFGRN